MSRRKCRDGSAKPSWTKRSNCSGSEPMPWLSSLDKQARPVFALTLQRMMSGCEMLDCGAETTKEQPQVMVDLNAIGVSEESLKLRLDDFYAGSNNKASSNGESAANRLSLIPALEPEKLADDYCWWGDDKTSKFDQSQAEQQSYQEIENNNDDSSLVVVNLPPYYDNQPLQPSFVAEPNSSSRHHQREIKDPGNASASYVELTCFYEPTRDFPMDHVQADDKNNVTSNAVKVDDDEGTKKRKRCKQQQQQQDCKAEKSISCNRCDRRFKKEAHLKTHFLVHTTAENGGGPSLCAVCGKGFCHRGALALHMRAHEHKQRTR